MKRLKFIFLISLLVILAGGIQSCTDNQRAKYYGGTMTVDVPDGEVFVNATWKDADLWLITVNPTTGQYFMHEVSNWGMLEGTVKIRQKATNGTAPNKRE